MGRIDVRGSELFSEGDIKDKRLIAERAWYARWPDRPRFDPGTFESDPQRLRRYYEAFIQMVDSMFKEHAKWLKVTQDIPWRRPLASLNYLLTSHVWRQDHNGFSHQDPGFIEHMVNKKADMIRVYRPPTPIRCFP